MQAASFNNNLSRSTTLTLPLSIILTRLIRSPLHALNPSSRRMASVAYINHDELAQLLKTGQAGKTYQVVDVRDDDFAGGNIVGALNSPSEQLTDESLDALATKLKDGAQLSFLVLHGHS